MDLSSSALLRIRITSDNDATAAISIRGALYGSGSSTIELVDGMTPLDVRIAGPVVSGMVQAVDVTRRLRVDVLALEGADSKLLMSACARTVLLGDHLHAGRFIRGAA